MTVKSYVRALWLIASIGVFSVLGAWSRLTHQEHIMSIIIFAYIAAFLGAAFAFSIKRFRAGAKEVESYLRGVKSGAILKLTREDFLKAIERDPEHAVEMNRAFKAQMKGLLLSLGIVIVALMALSIFSHYIESFALYITSTFGLYRYKPWFVHTIEESIEFYKYLINYLIYFTAFFTLVYVVLRVVRAPLFGMARMDMPYTVNKELIAFKDALIIDGMFLLRAPIEVRQVVINERRRFLEFELVRPLPGIPYRRIRIYHRSPRDLWEGVLKGLFRIVSS